MSQLGHALVLLYARPDRHRCRWSDKSRDELAWSHCVPRGSGQPSTSTDKPV